MSIDHEYLYLAVCNNNRIQLIQEGLQVLNDFDFCSIVTVMGDLPFLPNLHKVLHQPSDFREACQGCVLIERNSVYSTNIKRQIVSLRVLVNKEKCLPSLFTFCALISNLVLICGYQKLKIGFLSEIKNFVKDKQEIIKKKVSAICGITIKSGLKGYLVESTQSFINIIKANLIQVDSLGKIYPSIVGYSISDKNQPQTLNEFQIVLEKMLERDHGNINVTSHGEVITQYVITISEQMNKNAQINLAVAEDQIQVEQNFEKYVESIEKYNKKCRQAFSTNDLKINIKEQLQKIRRDIEQKQSIMHDEIYSKRILRYMDKKQSQLMKLNEEYSNAFNLNILQAESVKAIQNVQNKEDIKQEDVRKQVEKVVNTYNQKAKGPNKEKLLTQFLQLFVPTISSEANVKVKAEKKLKTVLDENKKLEEQLKKLQRKKNNGICCSLM